MKAQTVDVKESTGRILCCTIFRPGGKKLLAKGPRAQRGRRSPAGDRGMGAGCGSPSSRKARSAKTRRS